MQIFLGASLKKAQICVTRVSGTGGDVNPPPLGERPSAAAPWPGGRVSGYSSKGSVSARPACLSFLWTPRLEEDLEQGGDKRMEAGNSAVCSPSESPDRHSQPRKCVHVYTSVCVCSRMSGRDVAA